MWLVNGHFLLDINITFCILISRISCTDSFSKLCCMAGDNNLIKFIKWNFSKNSLFAQIINFGPNVAGLFPKSTQVFVWGFALRIFFKLSRIMQDNKYKEIAELKFPKTSWAKWAKLTKVWPRTIQAFISRSDLGFFQVLHHDRAQ